MENTSAAISLKPGQARVNKTQKAEKAKILCNPSQRVFRSQDSSAAPQSDVDNVKWDSSSMASYYEEESATDGKQSNNHESQPADNVLFTSQATDMSDPPNWSDNFFTAARVKRKISPEHKNNRKGSSMHAAKWGPSIPPDGGVLPMKKAQIEDQSLRDIRKKCDAHE